MASQKERKNRRKIQPKNQNKAYSKTNKPIKSGNIARYRGDSVVLIYIVDMLPIILDPKNVPPMLVKHSVGNILKEHLHILS